MFSFYQFIEITQNTIIKNKVCPQTLAEKIMALNLELNLLKLGRLSVCIIGFDVIYYYYFSFFFKFPSVKSSEIFTADKTSSVKSFKSENGRGYKFLQIL